MRICDRCTKQHATTRLASNDLCHSCFIDFTKWIDADQPRYVVNETLNKDGSVKSREIVKQPCTNCDKEEGWVED